MSVAVAMTVVPTVPVAMPMMTAVPMASMTTMPAPMAMSAAVTTVAAGDHHPAVDGAAVAVITDAAVGPEDRNAAVISHPGAATGIRAGTGGGRGQNCGADHGDEEEAEQFHGGEWIGYQLKFGTSAAAASLPTGSGFSDGSPPCLFRTLLKIISFPGFFPAASPPVT